MNDEPKNSIDRGQPEKLGTNATLADSVKAAVSAAAKEMLEGLPIGREDVKAKIREAISLKIAEMESHQPVVAIFGKTGVGKSSLINAIFSSDVAHVSHVDAGTRSVNPLENNVGKSRTTFIDFPGIGEDIERDNEYHALYREWLPKIDVILWVVKVDDRAAKSDLDFWNDEIRPLLVTKQVLVVVSQCEKAEPLSGWDWAQHAPSEPQRRNIEAKGRDVGTKFGVDASQVICISAQEGWNIADLSTKLVEITPDDLRLGMAGNYKKEYWSLQSTMRLVFEAVQRVLINIIKSHSGVLAGRVLDLIIDVALTVLKNKMAPKSSS